MSRRSNRHSRRGDKSKDKDNGRHSRNGYNGEDVLQIWTEAFPNAEILTKSPSEVFISHSLKNNNLQAPSPNMTVHGIAIDHPLVTNASYGYEVKPEGLIGNFYEGVLPEAPGFEDEPTATEAYVRELFRQGFYVQADHFHWSEQNPQVYWIHHKSFRHNPIEFSEGTIAAYQAYAKQYNKNKASDAKRNGSKDRQDDKKDELQNNKNNELNDCKTLLINANNNCNPATNPLNISNLWSAYCPDSKVLVARDNYFTMGHTFKNNNLGMAENKCILNQVEWHHPIVTNALYGYQIKNSVPVNFYQIELPESDGINGSPSAIDAYVKALESTQMRVGALNYHWKGSAKKIRAIHHSSCTLLPDAFSNATLAALQKYNAQYASNEKARNPTVITMSSNTMQPIVIRSTNNTLQQQQPQQPNPCINNNNNNNSKTPTSALVRSTS